MRQYGTNGTHVVDRKRNDASVEDEQDDDKEQVYEDGQESKEEEEKMEEENKPREVGNTGDELERANPVVGGLPWQRAQYVLTCASRKARDPSRTCVSSVRNVIH